MANTLIVRYNRLGDAIIALPFITGLAKKYSNDTFTVLTAEKFLNLIQIMPANVKFEPMISHRGSGLSRKIKYAFRRYRLQGEMRIAIRNFDKIAFFQYGSFERKLHKYILNKKLDIQVSITDESQFRSAERLKNKCNDSLTVIKLYKETVRKLGYNDIQSEAETAPMHLKDVRLLQLDLREDRKIIAVSPFSRLETKIYPLEKMEQVVAYFASKPDEYQVLILGGGKHEEALGKKWEAKYPSVLSLIGKLSFDEEVAAISKCSLVLALDSFNMHLASLLHIPIISIWGATVPQCGYYPEREPLSNAIYRNLSCQPCSFYGETECSSPNKYECFEIPPQVIIEKMERLLNN